ncbi:MAG: cation-translocating P-type ATPase [Armatimonadota bacterium]|nr:cation-translocating P-type ATPase [Armatimonadota bacterium]
MGRTHTIEIPVSGMDCGECAAHVRRAVEELPGVESVRVLLGAGKAVVRLDPARVSPAAVRRAIEAAGYSAPTRPPAAEGALHRPFLTALGVVFGIVLFAVAAGEWLGLFDRFTARVPWPVGAAIALGAGYPVFRNVVRAALRRRITAHTLMTLGVVAALAVGEWATALVLVFFIRLGDYVERFTTDRARSAIRDLTAMAPQMARLERDGREVEIPVEGVRVGEIVVVRPGERIPVDGEVVAGTATVDQAAITGEAMPAEVGPGSKVFAATIATLGSLRIRATHVGSDSTFGRVIRLVEEAEAHKAEVHRTADRFAAYYLPVVAAIGGLTLLVRRDPLAMAAVFAVACSCSFALATPIAMLASIGAAARRGVLVKGGRYLEALARADVVLVDKTGTLTTGRPRITEVLAMNGASPDDVLALAASAERDSEHPLARAVRHAAQHRGLASLPVEAFEALPGAGVRARVDGHLVAVGSERIVPEPDAAARTQLRDGQTALYVVRDGKLIGVLAASDSVRDDAVGAIRALQATGIRTIELLTGDNEASAATVADAVGIPYRANLLPADKLAVVGEYQAAGHTVVMVGDGVNDAPALARADVGIALGAAGHDVAIEAAHVALLRDDWHLVPALFEIARRTMGVVRLNIGFTTLYNLVGISLAALGYLPPIFAAAAQSLPDIGILANSSRLLRQGRSAAHPAGRAAGGTRPRST